jgi:hypothetical protein
MLTIYNTDKIVMKTIGGVNRKGETMDYQVEWVIAGRSYYGIKLFDPFSGGECTLFLYREGVLAGPITNQKYYKVEDQSSKKSMLVSYNKIKDIDTFLNKEIKFMLENI